MRCSKSFQFIAVIFFLLTLLFLAAITAFETVVLIVLQAVYMLCCPGDVTVFSMSILFSAGFGALLRLKQSKSKVHLLSQAQLG